MKHLYVAALTGALAVAGSTLAEARDRHWTVRDVVGTARIQTPFETRNATSGMRVNRADNVETGAGGQIVLARGRNSIAAYENSSFQISTPRRDNVLTRVAQQAGELLFNVESRADRHFEVETPYLVVGVKGTAFGVTVSQASASVSVVDGVVGVSDSGATTDVNVAAGQTIQVAVGGNLGPVEQTPQPGGELWTGRFDELDDDDGDDDDDDDDRDDNGRDDDDDDDDDDNDDDDDDDDGDDDGGSGGDDDGGDDNGDSGGDDDGGDDDDGDDD